MFEGPNRNTNANKCIHKPHDMHDSGAQPTSSRMRIIVYVRWRQKVHYGAQRKRKSYPVYAAYT